jgi:colanic acid/amylovoran biosynthesis glycosyltransferase
MRVAFFVWAFPKLSETFVLNQVTGLIDRGCEVDIYADEREPEGASHPSIQHYDLLKRTLYPMPPRDRPRRLLRATWELTARFKPATPRLLRASLWPGHGHRPFNSRVFYDGLRFLDKPAYDIAHFQFGYAALAALPLLTHRVIQGRIVVSLRGADLFRSFEDDPKGRARLIQLTDLWLPVSHTLQAKIIALGAPPERVEVHRSGIMLDRFPFEPRVRAPGEPTRIVSVGRFVPKKGFHHAIEAVARLVAAGHPITYTLIGSGRQQRLLERQIATLGLQKHVQLLESQPHDKIIAILRGMHCLLAPSVTAPDGDQEGIPNVLKEAMAMGIPVVSTHHSGIPELVQHGVSGYLAREGDSEALTQELIRIITEPERWQAMGEAGRRRVEAEFNSEQLNDRLVALYRNLKSAPPDALASRDDATQ